MRVFKENQKFNQWWIYVIFILIFLYGIFQLQNQIKYAFILISGAVLAITLFSAFTLETKIDRYGIHTFFKPFPFFKKSFRWKEIKNCYVRTYAPVREYGGWGIRGIGKAKAYNVKGNKGIQIHTKSKASFLIGTQNPKQAEKTIKRYFNPEK